MLHLHRNGRKRERTAQAPPSTKTAICKAATAHRAGTQAVRIEPKRMAVNATAENRLIGQAQSQCRPGRSSLPGELCPAYVRKSETAVPRLPLHGRRIP